MAEEIELKLDLESEAADFLEASSLLPAHSVSIDQRAIYFDTPGQDLRDAGISLRIRHAKGQRIQTVKATAGKAAGLFVRPEWEMPVDSDVPVIDESTPIRSLLGDAIATIAPAFEVRVVRRVWDVTAHDARIEMVLDRGAAQVAGRRSDICEVELELLSGPVSGLFAFAREIDAIAPVRPGVLSKSERGYRLIAPAAARIKSEAVPLERGMSTAQAFRIVAGSCLRHYRLNEALMLESGHADALHQARVALRRLRSAFSIFRAMLDDERSAYFREELKWLAAAYGNVRNLDVLLTKAMPDALRARLTQAQSRASDVLAQVLRSQRARALMLDLVEWLLTGSWLTDSATQDVRDRSAVLFAADALGKSRRRVKKHGGNLAGIDDEARHRVRKDAKKLRYAAEFFAQLFADKQQKRRRKAFLAALEALQDNLGGLNDLATARDILKALNIDDDDSRALFTPGGRQNLLNAAVEAHDDLVDSRKFWT